MVALGVIVFLFLFAFVGPLLIPYGYDEFNKGAENLYPYHYTLEDQQRVNDEIAARTQSDVVDVDEMIAQAKEEAGRILARAQEEARLEKQKMSDEIKQEIVSVASVMAGKLVGASIDTARQNSLIEETLKEMGEDTWQN